MSDESSQVSSETDVAEPQEVAEFLTKIMRGGPGPTGVKQNDRVAAAAGLTNYFLAHEIASLVGELIAVRMNPAMIPMQQEVAAPPEARTDDVKRRPIRDDPQG